MPGIGREWSRWRCAGNLAKWTFLGLPGIGRDRWLGFESRWGYHRNLVKYGLFRRLGPQNAHFVTLAVIFSLKFRLWRATRMRSDAQFSHLHTTSGDGLGTDGTAVRGIVLRWGYDS